MKSIYSSLVALVVFVVLASLAIADPGTTWENKIVGAGRFQVLNQFGGAAVFDRETGRVWEQSPSMSTFNWVLALSHCYQLEVGGRKGWRLPTVEELASLVATSQPAPTLPASHPFNDVQSFTYWSATTSAADVQNAWVVRFNDASVGLGVGLVVKAASNLFVWCVRGGQGIDGVQ